MRLIRLLKRDLAQEMEDWIDAGLIEPAQVQAILLRYGIKQGESSTLGYAILLGLGLLFVGLALIILVSANWDEIPRLARMLGLIALTATVNGVAIWHYHKGQVAKAVGGFFIGNFCYGASIILIAQIYHLGEHMPDGVFWWALGCMPAAGLLRSRLLTLQMLVLAIVWLGMEGSLGFYASTFPLFLITAYYVLFRSEGSSALFLLAFMGLIFWLYWSLSVLWQTPLGPDGQHLVVATAFLALAHGLSRWLANQGTPMLCDYGAVLGVWTLRLILLLCFILSFVDPWEAMIEASWDHVASMSVIAGLFWAVALILAYRNRHLIYTSAAGALVIVVTALVIMIDDRVHGIWFQAAGNVMLVAIGVGLIMRGIQSNVTQYFWTGVSVILLVAMVRYFDLIGDYIGGAILFVIMGGILLGAAHFWKLRASGAKA